MRKVGRAPPETEDIIERVAALDIGKAEVMCCVRAPDEGRPGRRLQEVAAYPAMTRSLLALADRLASLGVTRVVMEATADYWKPPFYLLEARGFETWLVNARDVRHLPGRPPDAARGLPIRTGVRRTGRGQARCEGMAGYRGRRRQGGGAGGRATGAATSWPARTGA
jgi:transposase